MRMLVLSFWLLVTALAQAQTYRVSELKFENFKAYDQYAITLDGIRSVLVGFSKANPTFDQGGLFLLAAQLSELYREQGLAFHRVEVVLGPPTRLVLVPGVMKGIDVRGNRLYQSSQIAPFFTELQGQLVDNATLQTAMTRLNSLPGMQAFAFLSFGQKPGDAVLNVSANQESWGSVNSQVNNFGSSSTGQYRLASQLTLNNLLKKSDQWQFGGSLSDDLKNWSANASVNFNQQGRRETYLNTQFQGITLTQEFSLLNLSGWQGSANVGMRSIPLQKLNSTFGAHAQLGYLQQSLKNEANLSFLEVSIQELPIQAGFKGDFAANKSYLGYDIKADAAYVLKYEAASEFDSAVWSTLQSKLSFAQSLTGGVLQKGIDFKTQIQAQYAVTELPSHRRFGLTGPQKIANWGAGSQTVDSGVVVETSLTLLNIEWGWLQIVLQGAGQAGFGTLADEKIDPLYAAGAVIDLNVGVVNSQLKAFTDTDFEQSKVWFEVGLNWPKGH